MAIFIRYKDTLDDFINNSNVKSLDRPRAIDKRSRTSLWSESSPMEAGPQLLKGNLLDKDLSDNLLRLATQIRNSLVHQRHDVAPLASSSRRAMNGKDQRSRGDEKRRKGATDRKG